MFLKIKNIPKVSWSSDKPLNLKPKDRLNARLMKTKSTGSGRRENYKHIVLPRMRNTMMLSGNQTQDEMIKSVDKGIFAVSFGGGQVDITSGKFVFNCTKCWNV